MEPSPGQRLARRIHHRARELREYGIEDQTHWAPGHSGIEGNERVDKAAKQAANNGKHYPEGFASLSHMARPVTERKWKEYQTWFQSKHRNQNLINRETYNILSSECRINKVAARYF